MGTQLTRIVSDVARRLMLEVRREVRERLGPDATFEQRRDAAAALASDMLWLDADEDLRESLTAAEEVVVGTSLSTTGTSLVGDLPQPLGQPPHRGAPVS
jgi:hypothetical protein